MPVIAVVGGQWGDEGKGKIIDLLAAKADVVVRAQGGDNAGYTVVNSKGKFALHLVPAGVFNPHTTCVIGPGVALNPQTLVDEIDLLHSRGISTDNLVISDRAHLVMPYHVILDHVDEERRGDQRIGTTGRGIGPTYLDKVGRMGLRVCDLMDPSTFESKLAMALDYKNRVLSSVYGARPMDIQEVWDRYLALGDRLRPYVGDTGPLLANAYRSGQIVLLQGANGTLLDLDHGTYPYGVSSYPTVAGLLQGAGIGPRHLSAAIGVFKAYTTRVGNGPMPTELKDDVGEHIRQVGREFGTTTGRPRRCGWFDAVAARHAVMVNGFDAIALTRLDILDDQPSVRICVAYEVDGKRLDSFPASTEVLQRCHPIYEELPGWQTPTGGVRRREQLPSAAARYVGRLEELIGAPVELIGVGEERHRTICTGRFEEYGILAQAQAL